MIYAVAIPLALILGFLVSDLNSFSLALLSGIILVLVSPLLFKWHHALAIFFWNAAFNAFFLPGSPDIWLVFAIFSLGVSLLNHIMFQTKFLSVPEMNWALFILGAVVIMTAIYRGGISVRALGGSSYGGRYYWYLLGGIMGYFALTAKRIPISSSKRMTNLFFLSGITYVLGNIVYVLGPSFYFFYYFVQAGSAVGQAASDAGTATVNRIQGLAEPSLAIFCYLLVHYGIRGLLNWSRPWRFLFLLATVGTSFFAGFRSILALMVLIFAFQLYFERLLKTRYLPAVAAVGICVLAPVLFFSDKMPPVVQRALSILPVKVSPEARDDANASTEWRKQMWGTVWKDVPRYLIAGKGYAFDPSDMYLTTEAIRMGLLNSYEQALLGGDYHNGPLSVIIPFGIPGVAAFLLVLSVGGWVLYSNFRYGDPRLQRINTVLLSYYMAFGVLFFLIFGAFNSQLYIFLGLIGFGVSLNGGVRRAPVVRAKSLPVPALAALGS